MTQRSYNNPRNQARQKHGDGIQGVSRKSAGSAKLKREAASSVYTRNKPKPKKGKLEKNLENDAQKDMRRKERRREQHLGAQLTELPEYKKWRRIWWVVIVIAVIACVGAFALGRMQTTGMVSDDIANPLTPVLLVLGYGGIIIALFIDLVKIRRMRKDLEAQAHTMSKGQLRKLDAAIDASDKRYEEEKRQRKGRRMPWSKKEDTPNEDSASAAQNE